jgi:formylglycine-generating enzyme required for sulfatase activity
MVWVPAGRYTMGCTPGQSDCGDDEAKHGVELTRGFYLGATEVTQGLWTSVMGSNPSHFSDCGPTCPVENVSWLEAVQFANALSAREGLPACYALDGTGVRWPGGLGCTGYRLPTESEWEVAARGGADFLYAGSDVLGEVGWTSENAGGRTHPVKQLRSNGWGLSDMTGNVWEWVWDVYRQYPGTAVDPVGASSGAFRVYRGGCWYDVPGYARVASRDWSGPGFRAGNLGFRLARTVP